MSAYFLFNVKLSFVWMDAFNSSIGFQDSILIPSGGPLKGTNPKAMAYSAYWVIRHWAWLVCASKTCGVAGRLSTLTNHGFVASLWSWHHCGLSSSSSSGRPSSGVYELNAGQDDDGLAVLMDTMPIHVSVRVVDSLVFVRWCPSLQPHTSVTLRKYIATDPHWWQLFILRTFHGTELKKLHGRSQNFWLGGSYVYDVVAEPD